MELKKHYKMYKSGKQLVVAAVATVAAGVMFAGNQSASADSWQAKSVDQVSAELQQAGNVSNYTIQNGDTVWALATALNMSVEDFSAQYGIANPELIIAGQSVNGQIVVVPVSSEVTVVSDADAAASQADEQSAAAASQAAASQADEQSAAAASQAAASQAAADSAYAASVAAAQQAQADSAAAASVAAAQQAQATVSSDAAQSAAPAATDQQASVDTPAQTAPSAPVATGSYADAVNQMNILRRAAGLAPVTFDEGLAAKAQARAEQLAGSVDESHWSQSYGPEVIAIGFGAGAGAINAWYHETNMDGAPGHYNWLMKATTTRVGFGYDAATGTFVGESN